MGAATTTVTTTATAPSTARSDADVAAAALLAAVADPHRLALLRELGAGTVCVCELQRRVPIAPNLLSYHLRILREAGLVVGTRRGRWVDYALTDGAYSRLHAALPGQAPAPAPTTVAERAAVTVRTQAQAQAPAPAPAARRAPGATGGPR